MQTPGLAGPYEGRGDSSSAARTGIGQKLLDYCGIGTSSKTTESSFISLSF
jgi:hypothetical protein